jgi:hypothetical protein
MATATIGISVAEEVAQAYHFSPMQIQWDIQQQGQHMISSALGVSHSSSAGASNRALYEQDFYAWTQQTAALIREGKKWYDIDKEILAEEVESLGKSEKRELEHRLEVLVMHLLTWRYHPDYREQSHSWYDTIREQRSQLARLLRDNPSLRPQVPTFLTESYPEACQRAIGETRLDTARIPRACPWTPEQVLNPDFWPEGEPTP